MVERTSSSHRSAPLLAIPWARSPLGSQSPGLAQQRGAQHRVLREYRGFHNHLAGVIAAGVEAGEFRAVNSVIMANVLEAICDIWALRQFAVRDIGLAAFKDEVMRLIDASLRVEQNGAG